MCIYVYYMSVYLYVYRKMSNTIYAKLLDNVYPKK